MDAELRPLRERAHRSLRAAFRVIADRLDEAGLLRGGAPEAAADTCTRSPARARTCA